MAGVVAGLLTSAVVKIAGDKISAALAARAASVWSFGDDLEDMKATMESVAAVLRDAEKQSVTKESVRLWLKRLKNAALDISDLMDECQDAGVQGTAKRLGMLSCLPIASKKIALANKMKKMREELRKIDEQHQRFNLTQSTSYSLDQQHSDERKTTSSVDEAKIIGRDKEKQKIIELLCGNGDQEETIILPIYGLGGMGKTTLAGLVYNDTQFKKYDHRAWVYVSQQFDLERIGRSIISQLRKEVVQDNTDMQLINQSLNELLPNKKILIVLDDLWEDNDFKLEKLKCMLRVGNKGSMTDVIVTTRNDNIAKKICVKDTYKLEPLHDDRCWDIIKRYSQLECKDNKEQFLDIGQDIAKKCGGVPLAAQALGYMLKSKDLNGWSEVKNSGIWNESFEDEFAPHSTVLPSLKLSFENMPPRLRLCFSYCAIIPKGYDINANDLIQHWVALDFIEPSRGKEYIDQLFGMSFLQHSEIPLISGKHEVRYKMHDLVHDLARSVTGDELTVIDAVNCNASERKFCRYALLTNYTEQTKLSNILPKKARALHFSSSSKLDLHADSFSFAKSLRILDFSACSGILLPASIGQLKQLKCLTIPKMQNERLPESIAKLSKLQYLNLYGSSLISVLPESIGKLGCLTYLGLSGCSGISKLPESFGYLKRMTRLDMSGCSLISKLPDSLGYLTDLQHLELSECSHVKAIPESLCRLTQLQFLNLSSCSSLERIPEAIGSLVDLQYLDMAYCWKIRKVPESFTNLRNLLHLDLNSCRIAKGLPRALCGLTALQYLDMSEMYTPLEDGGLLHDSMRNLTNLKYLGLSGSIGTLFCAPSVNRERCLDFVGSLTNMEHLDLSGNSSVHLPDNIGNLKRLQTLNLSYCTDTCYLPASISAITLKSLLIEGCSDEVLDQAYQLPYSLTLPLFKVRASYVSANSNLPLLEGANVPELRILSLENVRFVEEAFKVKLSQKNNLSKLTLAWTLHAYRFVDDKDLLRELEPPRGLKKLVLEGYSSPSFPSWLMGISHHLPNIVHIGLDGLPTCINLPALGQLPNLEGLLLQNCPSVTKIDKDFCGGKGAFPRLSRFFLRAMEGLEEWITTYSVDDGAEEFMFPVLDELEVKDCPNLRLKPYCPPVFGECTIVRSDQVISSLEELGRHRNSSAPSTTFRVSGSNCKSIRLFHHFPDLNELVISACPELASLPAESTPRLQASLESLKLSCCESIAALPEWLGDLSLLRELVIAECPNLTSLPESMRRLTSLQSLELSWCRSISSLPEWLGELSPQELVISGCPDLTSLPESMRRLASSLESLELSWCKSMSALPEWLGDLSSLRSLNLTFSSGIKCLPPSVQKLTRLRKLRILGNPELKQWCESKKNRAKLAHIHDIESDVWNFGMNVSLYKP